MRTVMAVIGGAVVGAGAALLFAPQSGRRTRSMIRNKATKYSHDAAAFAEKKGRHLRNKMHGCAHKARGMMSKAQEAVDRAQEAIPQVQTIVDRAAEAMHKAQSTMDGMTPPEPATPI